MATAALAGDPRMDALVAKITALAADKLAQRALPEGGGGLYRLDDIPEPAPAWHAADQALRDFANELFAAGGVALMTDVYDEAAERHGHRSVMGVSASWNGCHGWMH